MIVTKIEPFLQSEDFTKLEQLENMLRQEQLWAMATPPYPVSHGEVHIEAVMNNVAKLLQAISIERPGIIDSGSIDSGSASFFQLAAAVLVHDLPMLRVAMHTQEGPDVARQEHASLSRLKNDFRNLGIDKIISSENDFHCMTLIAWAHAGDHQFSSDEKAEWVDKKYRSRTGEKLIPLCMRLLRFADLCDVGPRRLNPLANEIKWPKEQIPHLEKHQVAEVVLTNNSIALRLAHPDPRADFARVSPETEKELIQLCHDIEQQFYQLQTCWLIKWDFNDNLRPGTGESPIRPSPAPIRSSNEEIVPEGCFEVGVSVDVAVTPNGSLALCRGREVGSLDVWDFKTREHVTSLKGHHGKVTGIAITQDGKKVVSGSSDSTLKIWNLETAECERTLEGHSDEVTGVAISPKRIVVSGSFDHTLGFWNIESGDHLEPSERHSSKMSVWALCITHEGDKVVSGDNDGQLRIWDISDRRCRKVIDAHSKKINGVAVTDDDSHVILGCDDGSVKLWNLSTAEFWPFDEGHSNEVNDVILTPDGKTVVTSSDDTTIKLWSLESRKCFAILRGHTDAVLGLAITRDQEWLLSTSKDGTLKTWPLSRLLGEV